MNLIRTAAWVCAGLMLASDQMPARAPAPPPIASFAQAQNRAFRNDNQQPTDQEWSRVLQWMEKHSPNRLRFYQKQMGRNQAQLLKARQLIWNEYRIMQAVAYRPLREALVAQAEAQDQVFGDQIALRESMRSHDADQQESARNALKQAVEHLVESQQTVVERRIDKLTHELDSLKEHHDKRVETIYQQKLHQITGVVTQDADRPQTDEDQSPE